MINVYSWPTPNGHKVHIMLEECGLRLGRDWQAHAINIGTGDQFTPEFLKISPNNKIPALVDPDGPDGKPIAVLCKQVEQATTDVNGSQGVGAMLQTGVVARVKSWTYNEHGQVLTEKDPLDNTTTYEYYPDTAFTGTDPNAEGHTRGDLKQVTNAAGQQTKYNKYNKNGLVLEMQDPNNVLTTYTYDARQRLTSTSVGGQITSQEYWPTGLLKKVTQPDGVSFVQYGYDDAHRLTSVSDNLGNSITYTLDNLGNRTAEEVKDPGNALRRQLTRSIDALGRVQQITGRQ